MPTTLFGFMTDRSGKKKESFDAQGRAAEILETINRYRGLKGRFINLCIELAHADALRVLRDELSSVERDLGQVARPGKKEDKKP
jgi:7,8-dihydro-6-hydroxymethylpterin-pyrophosphokinase